MKRNNKKTAKPISQGVPELLTITQVAERAGLPKNTIRVWVSDGVIPCIVVRKKHLISWEKFLVFLNSDMNTGRKEAVK